MPVHKDILLSICLPTYNQPEAVEAFLKSAAPQLTPEVEIVIWDDTPADTTGKVVEKYAGQGQIRYLRGVESGLSGIDRAVVGALKEAKGSYVWTFGDEILEKGAIQKVLSLLKENPDLALVWVNSRPIEGGDASIDLGGNKFFRDADEVLEQIGTELSFISATVFDRKKALRGERLAEKYMGSTFVHIYMVLTAMSQGGRFYFLDRPFVLGPTKSDDFNFNFSKDVFRVYANDLFKILNSPDFRHCFSRKSIRRALAVQFEGMWRGVLVARARGYTNNYGSPSPKIPILIKHFWSYPEILIAVPLLLLPRWLDKILYKFYKRFFSRGTRLPRHIKEAGGLLLFLLGFGKLFS